MSDVSSRIKVLYIAGASRSGSTILEHSLASFEGVRNCGELRRLRDFYRQDEDAVEDPRSRRGCTCGKKIAECEFWQRVEEASGLDFSTAEFSSQLSSVHRSLYKFLFFLLGPRATRWLSMHYGPFKGESEAAESCFRVFSAIASIEGGNILVDASKMVHQFLMLKAARPEEVMLIALVRDGRGVSKSMTRGERRKYFTRGRYGPADTEAHLLRAAVLAWMVSTVQTLIFYFRTRRISRYFVKYESFCSEPESVINDILLKFGIDRVERDPTALDSVSHSIGGSPSRFKSDFKDIELNEDWRNEWTDEDERVFSMYGGALNRILGYR